MAVWDKKCTLWRFILCSLLIVGTLACIQGVSADEQDVPSESQCRPYIEKALKDLTGDVHAASTESESKEAEQIEAVSEEDTKEEAVDEDSSVEILTEEPAVEGSSEETQEEPSVEVADEPYVDEAIVDVDETEAKTGESTEDSAEDVQGDEPVASDNASKEEVDSTESVEQVGDSTDASAEDTKSEEAETTEEDSLETKEVGVDESIESVEKIEDVQEEETVRVKREIEEGDSQEAETEIKEDASVEQSEDSKEEADSKESDDSGEKEDASKEDTSSIEDTKEDTDSKEESDKEAATKEADDSKEVISTEDDDSKGEVDSKEVAESEEDVGKKEESIEQQDEAVEETAEKEEAAETEAAASVEQEDEIIQEVEAEEKEESEEMPENDLLMEMDIPENLRPREHISQLLRLDEESTEAELLMEKSADVTLRELKRLYDGAIKPLEILYKYRDLSNRHFGDPEIFSKPLVLFMGPWSGGKSSLINYLTNNEFTEWSLRTGAEPSPAYFNILMHGPEPQVLDGTQLAADWTFSGLQKFGQGLEERLRGLRLPNKLLEKVNIVEIPGILEVRKQVSRVFPFNDACQWFIDRADVIFLVYDPSKLDVGPETEAILDQLKGREPQTRIILNKADQVKPEELMRVQSALIWNISPLMSSAQPPLMYTTSLWSLPYESGAPTRLLQAQERSFLRDLRTAIDRRVENKIASARRFAVRVRNHAKMVDCYLTTYYNHKTIFGNKKIVAEAIIEHPQNYHIYEGLSTLTNISRYDLPDPETYRDFFRLNPLYDFQQLAATCTYFRGCPINRLDVAIAYDLPELVGKYKKMVESATPQGMPKS